MKIKSFRQVRTARRLALLELLSEPKTKTFRFISDKCAGLLLRARRYKLVTFAGEMLFQV